MLKRIATFATIATCLVVAGCNTVQGAKQDAKSVGDTVSNATK